MSPIQHKYPKIKKQTSDVSFESSSEAFSAKQGVPSRNIFLLRLVSAIALLLVLHSWMNHDFSFIGNDRIVLTYPKWDLNGIPVKWAYSGWSLSSSNQSVPPKLNKSILGQPLKVAGKLYENGIGTYAPSKILLDLNGKVSRFTCQLGLDDAAWEIGVGIFRIYADGKKIYESVPMSKNMEPLSVDLDVRGKKSLCLSVDDYDNVKVDCSDWLNLRLEP